jgi:hypothetical protein
MRSPSGSSKGQYAQPAHLLRSRVANRSETEEGGSKTMTESRGWMTAAAIGDRRKIYHEGREEHEDE